MAGIRAAIDMQKFGGEKAGLLKREHCLDDVAYSPIRPTGCRAARNGYAFCGCIGVLMTPGETAFTRIPFPANSIATATSNRAEAWQHSRRRLEALEGQNPHSLASVNRTLVRFGLDYKPVALDGVKANLLSSKSASVPFDINAMNNLPGRQLVRTAICKHLFM
jgi:hypothetical protein